MKVRISATINKKIIKEINRILKENEDYRNKSHFIEKAH